MSFDIGQRLGVTEVSPSYWTVTIDNPPINLYDPRRFSAFNELMGRIDDAGQLKIVVGSDDFDADTAEKYGWVNRSIPDAEPDPFVDNFARRVAGFDTRPLELANQLVNGRAGVPSEADRWNSNHAFIGTTTWPETRERIGKLMEAGLQKDGPFELDLGRNVENVG